MNINLRNDWKEILKEEFNKDYFIELSNFVDLERKGKTIFPVEDEVFQAFNLTSFKDTKVVIIGQDPYHGENQAHGLCFSVKKGNKIPPSLRNIYKELNSDLNCEIPTHGYLTNWANQGILMLNAVFTVEKANANSHKKQGWEKFTEKVIETVNKKEEPVVFILWGNFAKKFEKLISNKHHFIIKSAHPSPLSASRGFLGSKPFSKTNDFLKSIDLNEIDWCVK